MDINKSNKKRIHLLDEIRGFAVFCMIFYHAFYLMGRFFEYKWANWLFDFFTPIEPLYAALFISVCGISCSLSHNNLKRGIKIFSAALVISLVTCVILPLLNFEGAEIYFGILHLLGVSVLVYALGEKFFLKINPYVGTIVCTVLFPFFSHLEKGVLSYGDLIEISLPNFLYATNFLMPFGFYTPWFYSADYFPIFPWIFMFFIGIFMGKLFSDKGFPEYSYKSRLPFFSFLGKQSFLVYILHMPLTFALVYGIDYLVNLFS